MSVNTRKVEGRRELSYETLDELERDVRELARAEHDGRLTALGNWTLAQAVQHLQRFMTCSIDGFGKTPWFLPIMGLPLRLFMMKRVLTLPTPPGMSAKGTPFHPDEAPDLGASLEGFFDVLERIRRGDRFEARSPLLGWLGHEKWTKLHLRHAELHLSFFKAKDAM